MRIREDCRDALSAWLFDEVRQDLRYTARLLIRAPAFSLTVILTLGLGIGANTALFSVLYGVLVRPLPYRDADRLVEFYSERDFSGRPRPVETTFSLVDLEQWRQFSRSLESVALVVDSNVVLATESGSESVNVATVTGDFFTTVGGRVHIGRTLGSADDQSPVVVISHALWQREFAGSQSVLGSQLVLDRLPYSVVGVLDPTFQLPNARPTDIWRTAGFARTLIPGLARRGAGGFLPIARLKPGVTIEQARADGEAVIQALIALDPRYEGMRVSARRLREQLVGDVKPAILVLFAAVGLVLFVACANVTNLLLARHTSRAREQAICRALGASQGRLARQALVYGAVLAACGAALGTVAAALMVRILTVVHPAGLPLLDAIRVDFPVLVYALGTTGLTTLAVGLVPALRQSEAMTTLRVGAGVANAAWRQGLRRTLVLVQLAVAAVLLVGASLLGRSLIRLMTIDIGISAKHVTAVQIEMFRGRQSSFAERRTLMDRLVDRVRSIPGVASVGAGVALPPNRGLLRFTFNRFDEAIGQPKNYLVDAVTATPDYFSTLGIRLRQGRFFTSMDDGDRPQVMILTAVTARQIFGDADPIGHTVTLPILTSNPNVPADHGPVTVIGVVDDVKYSGLDVPADGVIYRPFAQQPFPLMFLVVRTATDVAGLERAVRRDISNIDPLVVVHAVNTVDGLISDAVAQPRFRAATLIGLATLTVALAAVGLYGVVAYMVTQRTSEIGVRMALGADADSIMGMVLREGMLLALIGASVGLLSALALTRILRSLLYGVQPTDAQSFVGAAAVLMSVTFLASYIPARRATRVDPLVALRCE